MKIYCAERNGLHGSKAAYALLRYAVSDAFGIAMPEVARLPTGKPCFPDRPDIHFSISHTSTHVMCAVAEAPVGVDIETVRPVRRGVAERVCAPEELRLFDFLELWVLKESYVKMTGNTRVDFRTVRFGRRGGEIAAPPPASSARVFRNVPGCLAASCFQGASVPDEIEFVDISKIFRAPPEAERNPNFACRT